jgi:hypothetical protein
VAAPAPSARVIERWQGRSVEEAAALAPYAAKVAATGLPLGMVDDPELAAAARVAAVPGRDQRDRPPPGASISPRWWPRSATQTPRPFGSAGRHAGCTAWWATRPLSLPSRTPRPLHALPQPAYQERKKGTVSKLTEPS